MKICLILVGRVLERCGLMNIDEEVAFKKETVDKIQTKLRVIRLTTAEPAIKGKIEEILDIINNELNPDSMSIGEIIYNKMSESKAIDKELHVRLYMLYRKLLDDKISEEDAAKLYQLYVS